MAYSLQCTNSLHICFPFTTLFLYHDQCFIFILFELSPPPSPGFQIQIGVNEVQDNQLNSQNDNNPDIFFKNAIFNVKLQAKQL